MTGRTHIRKEVMCMETREKIQWVTVIFEAILLIVKVILLCV